MRGGGARGAAASLAMLLAACSTTATITHLNGAEEEVDIVGGTPSSIVVDSPAGRRVIPRSDIRDIDHPGNVHAIIGGALLGYGAVNIAVGLPKCGDSSQFGSSAQQNGFCVGLFIPAAIGATMAIWGLLTHSASASAADDTSMNIPAPPPYAPALLATPYAPAGAYAPPAPPAAAPPPPPASVAPPASAAPAPPPASATPAAPPPAPAPAAPSETAPAPGAPAPTR